MQPFIEIGVEYRQLKIKETKGKRELVCDLTKNPERKNLLIEIDHQYSYIAYIIPQRIKEKQEIDSSPTLLYSKKNNSRILTAYLGYKLDDNNIELNILQDDRKRLGNISIEHVSSREKLLQKHLEKTYDLYPIRRNSWENFLQDAATLYSNLINAIVAKQNFYK